MCRTKSPSAIRSWSLPMSGRGPATSAWARPTGSSTNCWRAGGEPRRWADGRPVPLRAGGEGGGGVAEGRSGTVHRPGSPGRGPARAERCLPRSGGVDHRRAGPGGPWPGRPGAAPAGTGAAAQSFPRRALPGHATGQRRGDPRTRAGPGEAGATAHRAAPPACPAAVREVQERAGAADHHRGPDRLLQDRGWTGWKSAWAGRSGMWM